MNEVYESLQLERPSDGLLLVRIPARQPGQAANRRLHRELGRVWRDMGDDPDVRAAVLTGEGPMFMPSVDVDTQLADAGGFPEVAGLMKEALGIVYGVINCDKPIVSAINGTAGGAGLAAALLADISVAGETTVLTDGHIRFGVAAGDHAAIIWPLLCGLAKAKYHILTSKPITGAEAERIGLVSLAAPDSDVLDVAIEVASGLARGPQHAICWTKRVLNHWLRDAGPIFEASLAYEAVGFFGDEHVEALRSRTNARPPSVRRCRGRDDPTTHGSAITTAPAVGEPGRRGRLGSLADRNRPRGWRPGSPGAIVIGRTPPPRAGLAVVGPRSRRRDRVLERFRSSEDPVVLISLKAGGVGLNLTEADYCFLLDPWWNPATEAQAIDRTHRHIGQTRQVMVYRLIARDTIEEKVRALARRKAELFKGVLDDGDLFAAAITADDIRGLLGWAVGPSGRRAVGPSGRRADASPGDPGPHPQPAERTPDESHH